MHPRAYAPDLDPAQPITTLSSEESGHLVRVLRLGAGARVLVFDGRGTQYLARIATAAKDSVTLALLAPAPSASEPRVRLTLAQAVLKGDKMDAVVRDATMMGVSTVIPLMTPRFSNLRSAPRNSANADAIFANGTSSSRPTAMAASAFNTE